MHVSDESIAKMQEITEALGINESVFIATSLNTIMFAMQGMKKNNPLYWRYLELSNAAQDNLFKALGMYTVTVFYLTSSIEIKSRFSCFEFELLEDNKNE